MPMFDEKMIHLQFHRSPSAQARIRKEDDAERVLCKSLSSINTETTIQTEASTRMTSPIEVPNKTYQIYRVESIDQRSQSIFSAPSLLSMTTQSIDQSVASSEIVTNAGKLLILIENKEESDFSTTEDSSVGQTPSLGKPESIKTERASVVGSMTLYNQSFDAGESYLETMSERNRTSVVEGEDFTKWARRYLYGSNNGKDFSLRRTVLVNSLCV